MTFGDPVAGVHAALAILAALHYRRRTGRGLEIDLSQQETMIAQQGEAIVKYSLDGRLLGRQGSKAYTHAPHGYYPCAGQDQWIAISVPDDASWKTLRAALGGPEWMAEARFGANSGRLAAQEELDYVLGKETATHEKQALSEGWRKRESKQHPCSISRKCASIHRSSPARRSRPSIIRSRGFECCRGCPSRWTARRC
jgi:benzylsuccinate CoA-transferase BbsF subunit